MSDWIRNNNFGKVYEDNSLAPTLIKTPQSNLYKDINSTSPIPSLTDIHISGYANSFNQKIDKAFELYNNGFICYIKYCIEGFNLYF